MKSSIKKIIATSCLLSLISISFLPTFAKKAEAQWVTFDVPTEVATIVYGPIKEFALDTIAWAVVNMIIERMAASTVNWINNGFKGSPAFVTNPEAYYKRIGDQVTGQLIFNHPDLRFMCSSLRTKVQIALTNTYRQPYNYQCTLGQIDRNFDGFMNDFNQGGWDGFIQVSQNSQNNPLGLYNSWNSERLSRANSALQTKQEELNQGKGFLSWKSCAQWSQPGTSYTQEARRSFGGIDAEGNEEFIEIPEKTIEGSPPVCIKPVTNTPGSVISEQLNQTLGIGSGRLQVADEINEMISALLNQLVSKALGAVGKGLRSLSSPSSGSNNTGIFTDQLATATESNAPDPYYNPSRNTLIQQANTTVEGLEADLEERVRREQELINRQNAAMNALVPGAAPPPAPAPLTCPAPPTLTLTPGIIAVGGTSFVSLPVGWTLGITSSDDDEIAGAIGSTVTGRGQGSAFINADNSAAPNGASPCTVFGATITVR